MNSQGETADASRARSAAQPARPPSTRGRDRCRRQRSSARPRAARRAQDRTEPSSGGVATRAHAGGEQRRGRRLRDRRRGCPARGSLRLKSENASPGKVFFYGKRKATYRYSIAGAAPRDLKIQAVNRSELAGGQDLETATTSSRAECTRSAGRAPTAGRRGAARAPTSSGSAPRHGADADREPHEGDDRSVRLFPSKFPVRGTSHYWDGFGARVRPPPGPGRRRQLRAGWSPRAAAASSTAATRQAARATTWSSTARPPATTTSTCT